MQVISWSNMGFIILSSYLLVNLFRLGDTSSIFKNYLHYIKALVLLLCSSVSLFVFWMLPDAFPVLTVLAIGGAVDILSSAVNKLLKQKNCSENGKDESSASFAVINKAKHIKVKNTSDEESASMLTKNLPNDINQTESKKNMDQQLEFQQREKKYLQEIAYLSQRLQNYKTAADKSDVQPPQINQESAIKAEQTSNSKAVPESKVTNELKLYLDKIDEHKKEIETLFNHINSLKGDIKSSLDKKTEESTIDPGDLIKSNEVKDFMEQAHLEETEMSPFLRSFMVQPGKHDN